MIEFVNNRTVYVGDGAVEKAVSSLAALGLKKAFAVVFLSQADIVKDLTRCLSGNGLDVVIYDGIHGEPNLSTVDDSVKKCLASGCDCVIACGGGSVIDTAKLTAMLATNGGCCEDYQLGGRPVTRSPLPFLAIPTTAGTGAEATKVSVIYNENKGFKKAVYDNSMIAQIVALDPKATVALPKKITAATGIDAIIHAVESFVSTNANIVSRMYSLQALKLLYGSIEKACFEPDNLEARTNMMVGSYFAGLALTAGSALAHIVGQPIGAIYHIPHGEACSAFFLSTIRLNKDYAAEQYTQIAEAIRISTAGKTYDAVFEELMDTLYALMRKIGVPTCLNDCVSPDQFDIEGAVENICSCMSHIRCNPRPVSRELYQEAILGALK